MVTLSSLNTEGSSELRDEDKHRSHWRKKLDKEFSPTDDTSDGIYIIIAF